jgi:uncharacterized damage-inducible protein DinB
MLEMIRTYYGYNNWATERLLGAAEPISAEQLNAPGDAGHGSIRDTLLHLFTTQRGWLSWWSGALPAQEAYQLQLDPAAHSDIPALRRTWQAITAETVAFLASLDEEAATREYQAVVQDQIQFRMVLWKMMLHVANHGTQHRSEVAAMLTTIGHSPGDLDLLHYVSSPAADSI